MDNNPHHLAGQPSNNPSGTPSKFKYEFIEQVYKYALLGLTDGEIAPLFDVTETTLNNWKIEHPLFFESLKKGKEFADAEVATCLYDRAVGMEYFEEVAIKLKKAKDSEEVKIVKVKRKVPPDVGAINSWLSNRQRKKWKNRSNTAVTGDADEPPVGIETKPDLSGMSDDEFAKWAAFHGITSTNPNQSNQPEPINESVSGNTISENASVSGSGIKEP